MMGGGGEGVVVAEIGPGFWQLAEQQRNSLTTIDTGDQSVSESRASWMLIVSDLHSGTYS